MTEPRTLPKKEPHGTWVQTERAAHEAWAMFLGLPGAVTASRVMHLLLARVGDHNAVVISQNTLAELLNVDPRTVRRAVGMLKKHHWLDTRQIGDRGTVNAYIINDRIGWSGKRDGIRYSLFSANVIISNQEQPDKEELDSQESLRKLPSLFQDEKQLPSGDGLPPVSQPFFDNMEPDLPATKRSGKDEDSKGLFSQENIGEENG
jgi:DNA-binding transcriptional MocR family regulator